VGYETMDLVWILFCERCNEFWALKLLGAFKSLKYQGEHIRPIHLRLSSASILGQKQTLRRWVPVFRADVIPDNGDRCFGGWSLFPGTMSTLILWIGYISKTFNFNPLSGGCYPEDNSVMFQIS